MPPGRARPGPPAAATRPGGKRAPDAERAGDEIRRRALCALDSDERRDRELEQLPACCAAVAADAAARIAARLRLRLERHEAHLAAGNHPAQWARWRAVVQRAVELLEGRPFQRRPGGRRAAGGRPGRRPAPQRPGDGADGAPPTPSAA